MKYRDFIRVQYPCPFSKNNLSGSIIFVFMTIIIFMSVFLYDAHQLNNQIPELKSSLLQTQQDLYYCEKDNDYLRNIVDRYEKERMLVVDVSAYTNRKQETDGTPNITATMDTVRPEYTVAVSHDLMYLLGHRIYIYGLGVFVVQDLMNERWKMRVDIYFDKSRLQRALNFGVKENMKLVVLNKVINYKYEEGKIINYD